MKKIVITIVALLAVCAAVRLVLVLQNQPPKPAVIQAEYFVDPANGSDDNSGLDPAAPLKTIAAAKELVRGVNQSMTGDIYVYLLPGTYSQTQTLNFDEKDSGTNGYFVHYKAHNMENKPLLTAGKTIGGWQLFDAEKNIYAAKVEPDDEFRQIYVNGEKAVRARSEQFNPPRRHTKDGYMVADETMQSWGNKRNIELICLPREWQITRLLVEDIKGSLVTIQKDIWELGTSMDNPMFGNDYCDHLLYFENAYELLDKEGEWYLDVSADMLYYKPTNGQDMTSATVQVPVLDTIINIKGSSNTACAQNLWFEGIGFTFTNWTDPSHYSHIGSQGSRYMKDKNGYLPEGTFTAAAALQMQNARQINVERCSFVKLGAIGTKIEDGSQNIMIRGNYYEKTCAEGIYFRTVNMQETDENAIVKHLTITNNYINLTGEDYSMASGVHGEIAQYVDITHNMIENTGYCGIELEIHSKEENVRKSFNLSYNHVKNVMTKMQDGGGIYTTNPISLDSENSRSKIMYNFIEGSKDHGLYTDNRSEYWEVAHNVCVDIKNSWMYMWDASIVDEYWHDNYTNTTTETTKGTNCVIKNTTYFKGTDYPAGAVAIIEKAGLEEQYRDIIQQPKD